MLNNPETILTIKLQEIIFHIYRFRFINRIQLQEILGHKDPSRINKWINTLVENDYIGRIYEKNIGKNRNPSIYYLKKKGIGFIRKIKHLQNPYINKLYREDIVSLTTQTHSLQATSFYLLLTHFAEEQKATLEYYTKAGLAEKQFFAGIKPDAYFTFETEKGKRSCFVEIDMETESRVTIRRKMQKYIDHYNSQAWKAFAKSFPIIATISLTPTRVETILSETSELLKGNDYPMILCKFATFTSIEKYGLGNEAWNVAQKKEKARLL